MSDIVCRNPLFVSGIVTLQTLLEEYGMPMSSKQIHNFSKLHQYAHAKTGSVMAPCSVGMAMSGT